MTTALPAIKNTDATQTVPSTCDVSECIVDIDAEDHYNPFCCAEYAEDIYRYLKKREV